MARLATAWLLCVCLLGTAAAQGTLRVVGGKGFTRVVLLADAHVTGPQYTLDTGSNIEDNQSALKSQMRLWQITTQKLANVTPPPQLAVYAGDIVHDGLLYSQDLRTLLKGPLNGYHVFKSILDQMRLPVAFSFGNHDALVECHKPEASAPRSTGWDLFKKLFGADPYTAVDLGGWKLLAMNSMLGYTWDVDDHGCNTRLSSYGERQLRWAARQLAHGKPTVVVVHYPLPTSVQNEAPHLEHPDLVSLLSAHKNVKLVLSGHFHKGYDWEDLYPFPHLTLPATRFIPDNFLLLDLYGNGTWRIPDWEKNKGGSRCSHAWRYNKDGIEPSTEEDPGDCGLPLAEETESYKLPPIGEMGDIPSDFNPELTCPLALLEQVFAPCLKEGASDACCKLMAGEAAPTSHYTFNSCFCQPTFWKEAGAKFGAARKDLGGIIDTCAERTHALIFHRGAGSCPGPKAGSWSGGSSTEMGGASKGGAAAGALLGRKGMGDGAAVE